MCYNNYKFLYPTNLRQNSHYFLQPTAHTAHRRYQYVPFLWAGSDGSVEGGHGAHSFVLTSGMEESPILGGAATTVGNSRDMSSLRIEHAGSAAIVIVILVLQR